MLPKLIIFLSLLLMASVSAISILPKPDKILPKPDKPNNTTKPNKPNKPTKPDKPNKSTKPDKPNKPNKPTKPTNTRAKSMFVFGDSLFDGGNNGLMKNCTIQANFPPYGSTFFKRPTGRFSNGRTVADFIAQFLGIELQKPYVEVNQQLTTGKRKDVPANGLNFASGGSGVLAATNKRLGVTALQVQTNQFQALIDKKLISKEQIANSLYIISSGSNDIFSYHLSLIKPVLFRSAQVDSMLKEVSGVLDKLCKIGARRIAVFHVGPMGCIPAKVMIPAAPNTPCLDVINDMIRYYNKGLEKLATGLPKKCPGLKSVYGLVYNITLTIQANPKKHGYVNIKDACCGDGPQNGKVQCGKETYKTCKNPHEYFFWDHFHPTEHTYEILAKSLWGGDKSNIMPMNIKTLTSAA